MSLILDSLLVLKLAQRALVNIEEKRLSLGLVYDYDEDLELVKRLIFMCTFQRGSISLDYYSIVTLKDWTE